LIQDQAPIRNVESEIRSSGFDNCRFLIVGCFLPTFATISAPSGRAVGEAFRSAFKSKADPARMPALGSPLSEHPLAVSAG